MKQISTILFSTVFFPLLQPVWDKEPFNISNISKPDAPFFLEDAGIKEQGAYFRQLPDPRIKSRIALSLLKTNNEKAVEILENMLRDEKNDNVISDLFICMYRLRDKAKITYSERIKKYMEHQDQLIRGYAAALYFIKTSDAATILTMLEKENSLFVQELLWNELASKPKSCNQEDLKKFLQSKDSIRRAGAVRVLALASKEPDSVPKLKKAAEDELPVRIALAKALKEMPDAGNELIAKLAEDKSSIVRALVASCAVSDKRLKTLVKLSGDKDWEVRRAACETLGGSKSPEAISALLARMNDNYEPVRTAAEDALVKINPGEDTIKKLTEFVKSDAHRDAAIRVLGMLGAKNSALDILNVLNGKAEDETVRRAVEALGRLECKSAADAVASKSSSKNPAVRKAVAFTIGRLGVASTFKTLELLTKDKDASVVLEAINAMGLIADKSFNKRLNEIVKDVKPSTSSDMRAYACWAVSRINAPTDGMMEEMKKLFLKKIIPMEGEKTYDADYARAAAIMALVEMGGKKNEPSMKAAKSAISFFHENPFKTKDEDSITLKEYMRQIQAVMNGTEIKPELVPTVKPELVTGKVQ